jgi:hypothetical protein
MKAESAGCPIPALDPVAPLIPGGVSYNLYREDLSADPVGYELLNPLGATAGRNFGQVFIGGSDDFDHVVYQSFANKTDPPDSPVPGNFRKLYTWVAQGEDGCAAAGGCLSYLAKGTGGVPFATSSDMPTIWSINGQSTYLNSAVSDDGERIFFQNPVEPGASSITGYTCTSPGCELYLRENAGTTLDVSASECTAACGSPQTKADKFLSATPSGSDAFFISCAKLTDASSAEGSCTDTWGGTESGGRPGAKLYRWDRNAAPGHRLVDLTADHEPADGDQPDFLGLIGESDDGDTAYFVTRNQIVSGAPVFPTTNLPNPHGPGTFVGDAKLYRWRWNGGSPTVDYLGPYQELNGSFQSDINWMQQRRTVTPDGKYLLLYSQLALDPAADRDADADAYRWDAQDGWSCVSCQLPGVPSSGSVDINTVWLQAPYGPADNTLKSTEPKTYMSNDGQRIFFGTPDALVPEDVNGEAGCPKDTALSFLDRTVLYTCEDVYEWHDGAVELITSGTSTEASWLISTTPSGNDVFFFTHQRLVGWDQDTNTDIYDSRVGGGFPEPPPVPPACDLNAGGCEGPATVAPPSSGAGTAVFQGPSDPTPKHPTAKKHHKKPHHKRAHKLHHRRAHKRATG